MNATIEVVCYTSKTLKDSTHPLMLRISKDGKKKYISLGLSVKPNHWDFTKHQPKPNCPNRDHIDKLILTKKTQYKDKIIEFAALQKDYTVQTLVDAVENKLQYCTYDIDIKISHYM